KIVGRREGCQKKGEKEKVIERSEGSWEKGNLLEEGGLLGEEKVIRKDIIKEVVIVR
ncbi:46198_t:CDS:1, partial [Gigaspora margarita]